MPHYTTFDATQTPPAQYSTAPSASAPPTTLPVQQSTTPLVEDKSDTLKEVKSTEMVTPTPSGNAGSQGAGIPKRTTHTPPRH